MGNTTSLAAGACGTVPVLVLMTVIAIGGGASAAPSSDTVCTVVTPGGTAPLTAPARSGVQVSGEQLSNAETIVEVGKALGMSVQAGAIAIMTAKTESGLLNLDHGDLDSLGLFQQRPSQGWGTATEILNPTYAATAFYSRLATITDWSSLSMAVAAQRVQASKYPDRYTQWADFGTAVAAALWDATDGQLVCTEPPPPELPPGSGPVAGAVLTFAVAQLGKPYVYGASGPDSYDCSGLALRAYQAAGIGLPRTSEEQWTAGPRVPADQLEPRYLVFFDPDSTGLPGHVGIYAGSGTMIDAPHTGGVVRRENIAGFGPYMGAVRPTDGHPITPASSTASPSTDPSDPGSNA